MNCDKMLNEAREIEKRFLQFEQFREDLFRNSDFLNDEVLSMNDKLSKLNSEINILQEKKKQLDVIKNKLETDVDDITEKKKQYDFLRTHLNALKQRKQLLEEYTLEKGLEVEEQTLKNKLEKAWAYFNEKNSKFDTDIKQLELKLANRREMVSKMYEKECSKYKTFIEKMKEENKVLEKKLNIIRALRRMRRTNLSRMTKKPA